MSFDVTRILAACSRHEKQLWQRRLARSSVVLEGRLRLPTPKQWRMKGVRTSCLIRVLGGGGVYKQYISAHPCLLTSCNTNAVFTLVTVGLTSTQGVFVEIDTSCSSRGCSIGLLVFSVWEEAIHLIRESIYWVWRPQIQYQFVNLFDLNRNLYHLNLVLQHDRMLWPDTQIFQGKAGWLCQAMKSYFKVYTS